MHFWTQFTHVSRHFGVYKKLGKTVLEMWSQVQQKVFYVSTKLHFEKNAKTKKKTKKLKTIKTFTIFGGF